MRRAPDSQGGLLLSIKNFKCGKVCFYVCKRYHYVDFTQQSGQPPELHKLAAENHGQAMKGIKHNEERPRVRLNA